MNHQLINFITVSVVMGRFRPYGAEDFINTCFASHDEGQRAHLLNKYQEAGENIFEFLPKLDSEHTREVNTFLNNLISPSERDSYDMMLLS